MLLSAEGKEPPSGESPRRTARVGIHQIKGHLEGRRPVLPRPRCERRGQERQVQLLPRRHLGQGHGDGPEEVVARHGVVVPALQYDNAELRRGQRLRELGVPLRRDRVLDGLRLPPIPTILRRPARDARPAVDVRRGLAAPAAQDWDWKNCSR